jgi:hypothetical protein
MNETKGKKTTIRRYLMRITPGKLDPSSLIVCLLPKRATSSGLVVARSNKINKNKCQTGLSLWLLHLFTKTQHQVP